MVPNNVDQGRLVRGSITIKKPPEIPRNRLALMLLFITHDGRAQKRLALRTGPGRLVVACQTPGWESRIIDAGLPYARCLRARRRPVRVHPLDARGRTP